MIGDTFQVIFADKKYWKITGWTLVGYFAFFIYIVNFRTVLSVLFADIPLYSKALFMITMPATLFTDNNPLSVIVIFVMGILLAVNVSFFVYYIGRARTACDPSIKVPISGISGLVVGALGIGCASCGTFILSYLLAFVGGSTILSVLPFEGAELGVVGVIGLGYSLHVLSREIAKPLVCVLEHEHVSADVNSGMMNQ